MIPIMATNCYMFVVSVRLKNCGIFRAVVHENWAHTVVCTEYLSILSLYVQEQEIESLAAIESELENVAQKLHELRRG